MQRFVFALVGVTACAAPMRVALGAITPISGESWLRIEASCGAGPITVPFDETVSKGGIDVDGVANNHKNKHDDPVWGASDADIQSSQDISITGSLPNYMRIDGKFDPNQVETHVTRPAQNGAQPFAEGRTDSRFEYVLQVNEVTPFSVDVTAMQTVDFGPAVFVTRIDVPGLVYSSPVELNVTDSFDGELEPGTYKFFVRQTTYAFGNAFGSVDEATATFTFIIGEVPSPSSASLIGLGAVLAIRRRR